MKVRTNNFMNVLDSHERYCEREGTHKQLHAYAEPLGILLTQTSELMKVRTPQLHETCWTLMYRYCEREGTHKQLHEYAEPRPTLEVLPGGVPPAAKRLKVSTKQLL